MGYKHNQLFGKIINFITLRKIIFFMCICFFAFSIGSIFTKGSDDISIGLLLKIVVYSSPFILILALVQFFNIKSIRGIHFRWEMPKISPLAYMYIVPLAVLFSFVVMFLSSQGFGFTNIAVFLCIVISYFISILMFFNNKSIYGVVIFLMTIPILTFFETQFTFVLNRVLLFGNVYISPTLVYLLSIFGVSLITVRTDWNIFRKEKTFFILVLLFFIYPLISCFSSIEWPISFWRTFLEINCPIMFFMLVIKSIRNLDDIKVLLISLVSYFAIFLVVGFYLHHRYSQNFLGEEFLRDIFITYHGSLNVLIRCSIILVPMILYLSMLDKLKKYRLLFLAIVIMFISTAFLLQDRTAIYGFAICFALLGIYGILKAKRKLLLPFLSITMFIIFAIVFLYISSGFMFQRLQDLADKGLLFFDIPRVSAWIGSVKMIRDYPFSGIGAGMWKNYVSMYVSHVYYGGPEIGYYYISYPHNFYLNLATYWGLPQLIVYFLLMINLFSKYKIVFVDKKDSNDILPYLLISIIMWLIIGITGGFYTVLQHNIGQWYRIEFSPGIIFWTTVASIIWLYSDANKSFKESIKKEINV